MEGTAEVAETAECCILAKIRTRKLTSEWNRCEAKRKEISFRLMGLHLYKL
jgi:hypothetical protein